MNVLSISRKSDAIEVDYIIRPSKSYPGGNYGSYGGYDVILLKLKKKVVKGSELLIITRLLNKIYSINRYKQLFIFKG